MNIVLGEENVQELRQKYIVLELDSFLLTGHDQPITAFCIAEDLSIQSLLQSDQMRDLHQGLIRNYRKKNWDYCLDALDHLRGKWDGQLDSFYIELDSRIRTLKAAPPDDTWNGVIVKK
jgi:hypothetical protein